MHTSELYKAGVIAFVIGLFIFFGHSHIIAFFLIIISGFTTINPSAFEIVSRFWLGLSAFGMILIISGVVMFYLGKRQRDKEIDKT